MREFLYTVNGYEMELNGAGLAYSEKRFRNRLPIHKTNEFLFELDENTDYFFKVHNVHFVSDEAIQSRLEEENTFDYNYKVEDDFIRIEYNNIENYPFVVLPVFNELGWNATVNGKEVELLNVNIGMIGLQIPDGDVLIELTFHQPYLVESIVLAILGLVSLIIVERIRQSKEVMSEDTK